MKLYFVIKRLLDFIAALMLIILLLPLFIVISAAIKLDSKGPVYFRQERVGFRRRLFTIYKFRTMIVGAEKLGTGAYTDENDPRITRVGAFLRKTSLDELPQLFNILLGNMSFIGPRPTLKYQVDEYTDFQLRRLEVMPGITGWAQVNGRNSLSWPERIILDVWYVDNISLLLDLKILFRTAMVVLLGKGLYAEPEMFVINNKDAIRKL